MCEQSPGPPDSPKQTSTDAAGDEKIRQDGAAESQKSKKHDEEKVGTLPLSQNSVSNVHDSNFGFDLNGNFPNMANMGMGEFNPMMQFIQSGMPNNMMGQFPNMMGKRSPTFLVR